MLQGSPSGWGFDLISQGRRKWEKGEHTRSDDICMGYTAFFGCC